MKKYIYIKLHIVVIPMKFSSPSFPISVAIICHLLIGRRCLVDSTSTYYLGGRCSNLNRETGCPNWRFAPLRS